MPMPRRSIVSLLLIALVVSSSAAISPVHGAASPSFKIVFPAPGDVINNGSLVIAELGRGLDRGTIKKITFEFSPNGTDSWKRIRGSTSPGIFEFGALWATTNLAGGDYFLRARLAHTDGSLTTKSVRVVVNQQPSALATGSITGISPRVTHSARKVQLAFNSNAKDKDGTVTSVSWDLGDGTTATGQSVSHDYPPGKYDVQVTATDDKGGRFISQHVLTVTDDGVDIGFQLHKEERCGCQSMQVVTEGSIPSGSRLQFGKYAGPKLQISEEERTKLGPYMNNFSPLPYEYDVAAMCRFMVVAEITGDPSKCAEGVRFQSTRLLNDKGLKYSPSFPASSDPRYDSSKSADDPYSDTDDVKSSEFTECPVDGDKWCDGGYHGGGAADGTGKRGQQPPFEYKEHAGNQIRMIFAPGLYQWWTKDFDKKNTIEAKGKYEAIVSGTDGTCRCTWTVQVTLSGTPDKMEVLKNEVSDVVCTKT